MLRLFVWENFAPNWKDGLAFAIAEDVQLARKMVIESLGYDPCDWGDVRELPVDQPFARAVNGGS
jgi:hypothetical protein